MNKKGTVEIEMKTKGFEDATENIEMIADAMDAFPSTINIKARDCKINIHNTNWIDQKQPAQKYAKGGLTADKGPEVVLLKADGKSNLPAFTDQIRKMIARDIGNMCRSKGSCGGCIFSAPESEHTLCKLNGSPGEWDL